MIRLLYMGTGLIRPIHPIIGIRRDIEPAPICCLLEWVSDLGPHGDMHGAIPIGTAAMWMSILIRMQISIAILIATIIRRIIRIEDNSTRTAGENGSTIPPTVGVCPTATMRLPRNIIEAQIPALLKLARRIAAARVTQQLVRAGQVPEHLLRAEPGPISMAIKWELLKGRMPAKLHPDAIWAPAIMQAAQEHSREWIQEVRQGHPAAEARLADRVCLRAQAEWAVEECVAAEAVDVAAADAVAEAEGDNMKKKMKSNRNVFILAAAVILSVSVSKFARSAAEPNQSFFNSENEAASAFVKALREDNNEELLKIFGPQSKELISSGDKVNDQQRRQMFLKSYDEQHRIETDGQKKVLVVGKNEWPFPIPLVKEKGKWIFDTAEGRQELLNRRIGDNELDTIQTMLAIVDAQREYAMHDYAKSGIHQYARKFKSDPGKKDGLYWEVKEGQEQSPLGPFISDARQEGYFENKSSDSSNKPLPYHGYFFRMLTAQGDSAEGGAFDYIVNGKMIGGFAVLAYPAQYGSSGVMSFIVNHDGVVYQKDLGDDTEQKAKVMKLFDPDKTWTVVKNP